MPDRMTRWGVGPKFAFLSIACAVPVVVVRVYRPALFRMDFVPYAVLAIVGAILIVVGVVLWLAGVVTAMRGFGAGKLCTNGVFAICRHPVYAAWVVFTVPGIVLVLNTSLGLVMPVIMYVLLRVLVRKEETYLEQQFGEEYTAYRKRVPPVAPFGWLRRN